MKPQNYACKEALWPGRASGTTMKCLIGLALLAASAICNAEPEARYTRAGCWHYCDEGVVVTTAEDMALFSSPPWHRSEQKEVGTVKKAEKVLVLRAETHGSAARLKIKKAKYGLTPKDEVWIYAYTGEGTWAIKHNGQSREWVELGYEQELCIEDAWCEMLGMPTDTVWSYIETSSKVKGWTNSNKLVSPKW